MTTIRQSSDNIFEDMNFSRGEAASLEVRSDLMIQISKFIERRGLTQVQAAKVFGVSQPRISDIAHGKISMFSVDMLITMLDRAGLPLKIQRPARRMAAYQRSAR